MTQINRIIIFYFTGTGNALAAAKWISQKASSKEIETQIVNIADKPNLKDINYDENTLLGFCFPTHGFNAPPIVIEFLRNFPATNNKTRFFSLNTRAGMKLSKLFTPGVSGLAFAVPLSILASKGYKCVGYRPLDMPSNWISIHPGLKAKIIASIFNRCEKITNDFISKILEGKKSFNRLYEIPIDILVIPIAFGYFFFGRFFLSKTFIATSDCNSCGICENECPVQAIEFKNGLPFWTYKCESCMHCMNKCPQRAIETPHGFTALAWWLVFGILPAIFLMVFNITELQQSTINKLIVGILTYVAAWFIIVILYKILHRMMKIKSINKIIAYTSLTKYKFWRRYYAPKKY